WALNRWGAHVRINLAWSRLDGVEAGADLAPPAPPSGAESAPPDSDEEPLQEGKNQDPASGGPTGVFSVGGKEEKGPEPIHMPQPDGPSPAARSVPGRPDLRHVVSEDLKDTGRLLDLYGQAVGVGLVKASECDRLRFVAAAEHARIVGTKNPCGLFVRLVRGGL